MEFKESLRPESELIVMPKNETPEDIELNGEAYKDVVYESENGWLWKITEQPDPSGGITRVKTKVRYLGPRRKD